MNLKGQKAGHYAFFYYSALLIFSFAVLTAVVLAVFPVEKVNACYEPPAPVNHQPVITLLGANPITITFGDAFTDSGATATDTEDGDITSEIVVGGDIVTVTTPAGTYTITYDVTDSGGLSAVQVTRMVVVNPLVVNTPPVIILVGANPITITVGDSYTDLGATASDTEDGDITSQIIASSTVNTAVVGTYTVTYNVVDSGGLAAVPALRTVAVTPVLPAPVCGDGICNGSESCGACSDCGSCSYGGGGDGGGDGSVPIGNGPPEFGAPPPVANIPMVLGVSTSTETAPMQCNYLLEYLKLGANNNPVEVYKLQMFLKNFEGLNDLPVTGIFDQPTFEAVSVFQEKYRQDVLEPWGHKAPTGYVYITTKKKVNEIYCRREFPLTDLQKQEIIDFRNLVNSLKTQGVTVPEAEAEEIFGGIGQTEGGQEKFSTSTLAVGINSEENGFQKGAFSAALAYLSGLKLLPSLLLFFLLFTTTSLLLLLRKCKRERI